MGIKRLAIRGSFSLMTRYYFRQFVRQTRQAGKLNRQVLQEVLRANAQTEYGLAHKFAGIKNEEEYKRLVPLQVYSDYESYLESMLLGHENILTAEPVKYFGLSSGTTGKQKYIPTTGKTQRKMNMSMMFLQQGLLNQALPAAKRADKGLLLMNMVQGGTTPAGIPTGSGTSGGAKSMHQIFPYFWTSPLEVLQLSDQQTATYLHLLFALKERGLAYIGAPFASGIIQLFAVLEERGPELVEDIAKGRISQTLVLEPETRACLEQGLKPDPRRAEEILRELAKGAAGIASRLWPQMVYLSCVISGSFSIYLDKLHFYCGDLPIFSAVYGATEALIGVATEVNKPYYAVTPGFAYYEFIPIAEADLPQPRTLNLDQLQKDQSYEIVVTNFSGFYRYRIGDVVKVVDYYFNTPLLEFGYRKGQLLNLAGEKTSEQAVIAAIQDASLTLGLLLEDFTVVQDLAGPLGSYQFYLEVADVPAATEKGVKIRQALDECLAQANPRYLAAVQDRRLAPLGLNLVAKGTFGEIRKMLVQRGASNNQVKVPRMVRDEALINTLRHNVVYEIRGIL
ncbi:GH3 auxin-responsive promoter-binding protein [Desulfosporosinus acidiphilus SJ4]|uniref:GH3 auxin-responsive promoter-binding protein n=1 Tax=Desulfosporosinus acidiphilus (strain DSM 22704 / JCM 16185 / SJ4) TaxID=646529 RepID=I4D4B0_DESAJ|nr:GH3 auxin-responsive promoter family protein [Desulfosporosinus acidiphilus]AFM40634.1 GH3 auxin-responsive promoter-binding protein [Desulfosporosinus acidiphilus SJ4]